MDYPPYKENKSFVQRLFADGRDSWGRLENGNGKKVLACSSPARKDKDYETCVYVVCALILWIYIINYHS